MTIQAIEATTVLLLAMQPPSVAPLMVSQSMVQSALTLSPAAPYPYLAPQTAPPLLE